MDLILHHYDQSPYSEKIRLIFGLKGLAWKSVIVPMVLPKPTLMPLTGVYRRTPVLQIGADIYCDTLRIAAELDRRFPDQPIIDPEIEGLSNILGTWAERVLMWPTARYVTGMNRDALSEPFFADRAAMRGHPEPTMKQVEEALPHQRQQLDLMLSWIENILSDSKPFLITDRPILGDLAVYQRLWWLGALDGKAAQVLEPYPCINAWMAHIAALGHGTRTELNPDEAIEIARNAEPKPIDCEATSDLAIGTEVEVVTEDYGLDGVRGTIVRTTVHEISIKRSDPLVGTVHVHFPHLGYEVNIV